MTIKFRYPSLKKLDSLFDKNSSEVLHQKIYDLFINFFNNSNFDIKTFNEKSEEIQFALKIIRIHEEFNNEFKNSFNFFGDMFGNYLEDTFQINKDKGQFFTPCPMITMMVEILLNQKKNKDVFTDMENSMIFYDPAAGTGRIMLGYADYYAKNFGMFNFVVCNIEIDFKLWIFSVMNAILYKIPSFHAWGNSLNYEIRKVIVVIPNYNYLGMIWADWFEMDVEIFKEKFFKKHIDEKSFTNKALTK